ncbi:hypothetical protein H696_05904 [Fonticula alba]|uniref:Rab3 GTPase-activating protein catalytic subunit n=1 Tax=Fonticula alba TaxID=691883 RepID=A0A058Z274_FONAL|nr:hypothetical protein H696_05904 [Fonticula alba]KCV67617.1 hypothetical protein H696_05904 [Fonticula alba]|eukprot:XP_009497955.1 hypothetical protein H696_05904 [Fonticula alba]
MSPGPWTLCGACPLGGRPGAPGLEHLLQGGAPPARPPAGALAGHPLAHALPGPETGAWAELSSLLSQIRFSQWSAQYLFEVRPEGRLSSEWRNHFLRDDPLTVVRWGTDVDPLSRAALALEWASVHNDPVLFPEPGSEKLDPSDAGSWSLSLDFRPEATFRIGHTLASLLAHCHHMAQLPPPPQHLPYQHPSHPHPHQQHPHPHPHPHQPPSHPPTPQHRVLQSAMAAEATRLLQVHLPSAMRPRDQASGAGSPSAPLLPPGHPRAEGPAGGLTAPTGLATPAGPPAAALAATTGPGAGSAATTVTAATTAPTAPTVPPAPARGEEANATGPAAGLDPPEPQGLLGGRPHAKRTPLRPGAASLLGGGAAVLSQAIQGLQRSAGASSAEVPDKGSASGAGPAGHRATTDLVTDMVSALFAPGPGPSPAPDPPLVELAQARPIPFDSFLWQLSVQVGQLLQSNPAIRSEALRCFWAKFHLAILSHWNAKVPIPRLETGNPNIMRPLLYQKLQMLNHCMKRFHDRQHLLAQYHQETGPVGGPSSPAAGQSPPMPRPMSPAPPMSAPLSPGPHGEGTLAILPADDAVLDSYDARDWDDCFAESLPPGGTVGPPLAARGAKTMSPGPGLGQASPAPGGGPPADRASWRPTSAEMANKQADPPAAGAGRRPHSAGAGLPPQPGLPWPAPASPVAALIVAPAIRPTAVFSSEAEAEAEVGARPLGRHRAHPSLRLLLHPDRPVFVPFTQEVEALTEDQLASQQMDFEQLGSSSDASAQRAQMQSRWLLSDMQAFKAANPGCRLEDFIRWHSPADWAATPEGVGLTPAEATGTGPSPTPSSASSPTVASPAPPHASASPPLSPPAPPPRQPARSPGTRPSHAEHHPEPEPGPGPGPVPNALGYLSRRFRGPNNFWCRLWSEARPVPVAEQEPLFDVDHHAGVVFAYLEGISEIDLLSELLPYVFLSCAHSLRLAAQRMGIPSIGNNAPLTEQLLATAMPPLADLPDYHAPAPLVVMRPVGGAPPRRPTPDALGTSIDGTLERQRVMEFLRQNSPQGQLVPNSRHFVLHCSAPWPSISSSRVTPHRLYVGLAGETMVLAEIITSDTIHFL